MVMILPNKDMVDEEYARWKAKWIEVPLKHRPHTFSDSLKHCCQQSLPNIFTLLKTLHYFASKLLFL